MKEPNKLKASEIEDLLGGLAETPVRNPEAQAQGRARFLAQARELAKSQPQAEAVSPKEKVRHTGWNKNFFERILIPMKIQTKLSALAAIAVVVVVTLLVVSNVTTVSAQQIIAKATAAQSLPTQGIWHTRIQIYQNHAMLPGDHPGTTKIDDDYYDLAGGLYRVVTLDSNGQVMQANAYDGTYSYSGLRAEGDASSDLQVNRVKAGADESIKASSSESRPGVADPSTIAKALFDQFSNNPRVKVDTQKKMLGNTPVFTLVDDNYQTKQGSNDKTFIGSTRMVFDAKTYQLLETQTTVHQGDQDIVIDEAQWLKNEILPQSSTFAWDLSDQKGIRIVDGEQQQNQEDTTTETLTEAQLATRTNSFYVLNPLPAGYTEKIIALVNQPKDQDYQFEVNYGGPDNASFDMQAIGKTDAGFISSNFYDGSYQTASGLVLNYSTSQTNGGTSAILSTPDGTSFLLISSLPRDQVQQLVEILIKGK